MKPFEVKLVLPVVAPLLDVVKAVVGDLRSTPAVAGEAVPAADADLTEAWRSELLLSQRADVDVLMALFGDEFFTDGVIGFDAHNAEAIVRACSAVRLRLRERYLQPLGDEALESGDVELEKLPDPLRKAFTCYLFLATIQELVIQHLDDAAP